MSHDARWLIALLVPLLTSPTVARAQEGLRPLPGFEARSVEFAREGPLLLAFYLYDWTGT